MNGMEVPSEPGFQHQRGSKRTRSHQTPSEPVRRRSNTAVSRDSQPTRSRGSTASVQSGTTRYVPEQQHHVPEGFEPFGRPQFTTTQHSYNGNPEDMIIRFGDQLANSHSSSLLDPALQEDHNPARHQAEVTLTGHEYRSQERLGHHGIPAESPRNHYQPVFQTLEQQVADPIGEENDGISESGPRKRKGTTSSIANDKELRRLLRQYDGYNLQQMAAEVQKHEGAGGKSEKVKQVFAMIWLKENCRKCSGSVRRDRVYCCYAEKCGTERVSVLNPASFGKLVRIIFPNVQTRRLGVRGESKYHYVDLTIVDQGVRPELEAEETASKSIPNLPGKKPEQGLSNNSNDASERRTTPGIVDAAQEPTPCLSPRQNTSTYDIDCEHKHSGHSQSRRLTSCEARNMNVQRRLRRILYFRSDSNIPPVETSSLRLPDVHEFLPPNSDSDVADALTALYRSHCISVIDSFRFCREKSLFRHFSSFQGTLTVPVQKLMVHPDIAPWIEECDWLMYQKMVAFVAPLSTQVIPGQVLKAFRSISEGLVAHISETFKPQPEHVSSARLAPAQLFCHLLTRMLDANQSANAAAAWLCSAENRTQMWEDFKAFVNPIDVVSKSHIPICSGGETMDILQERLKLLLSPLLNQSPQEAQFQDHEAGIHKLGYSSAASEEYTEFPDRWISFIYQLPLLFPGHDTQCMVEKADTLWTTVLHRLTLGGCQSFSAWWMTKVFFLEMIHWHSELGGFMDTSPRSLRILATGSSGDTNGLSVSRAGTKPASGVQVNAEQLSSTNTIDAASAAAVDNGDSGGVDGASVHGNKNNDKSPMHINSGAAAAARDTDVVMNHSPSNNDDSAIGLDDDSMLLTTGKYGDMMASDPADAEGDVVVV